MTLEKGSHVTRVLMLGDDGIGKTSLARTITRGVFPSASSLNPDNSNTDVEYVTSSQTSILAGDTSYVIHIHDADGDLKEGTHIDVIYLCFDVTSPATFDAVQTKWLPKAESVNKTMKNKSQFILIGLKWDLVHSLGVVSEGNASPASQPITASVASQLANEIRASIYVQVSSLKYLGIEKVKEQTVFGNNQEDDDTSQPSGSFLRRRIDKKCCIM